MGAIKLVHTSNRGFLFIVLAMSLMTTACGRKPAALRQPPPKKEDVQRPEPAPVEKALVYHDLDAIELGEYIVTGTQVGEIEAGGEGVFELGLFDAMEFPGSVHAWVGPSDPEKANVAQAVLDTEQGKYKIHLELPRPLPPNRKLWVEMEIAKGKFAKGSFTMVE